MAGREGIQVYAESLIKKHLELLQQNILGNPHSQNPASLASTQLVERARADVLRYFNADPDEYLVIFTANASGGLKLLAESYPFDENGHLLLVADNHNSVHGIREFARARNACITYIPLDPRSLAVNGDEPEKTISLEERLPNGMMWNGAMHPLKNEYVFDMKTNIGLDIYKLEGAFD